MEAKEPKTENLEEKNSSIEQGVKRVRKVTIKPAESKPANSKQSRIPRARKQAKRG